MNNCLQQLVTEYKESKIQSEEEVRTKLIIPLLDALGYPSYLRAEDFPVYGYGGRTPVHPKEADFILFKDKDFASHRGFNQNDIDWVYSNSLLIVEAKKPGEMPAILGQPQFYTVWTKAVAYLAIDGIVIKGYFYNSINQDSQIIECNIDDLQYNQSIWNFSYENIHRIKNESESKLNDIVLNNNEVNLEEGNSRKGDLILEDNKIASELSIEDIENISKETLQYMKDALGEVVDGLGKEQLIDLYVNTANKSQNNYEYDLPQYIYDNPKKIYTASVYINNFVISIDKGEIRYYPWNGNEIFFYESDYFQIEVIYKNYNLIDFDIGYHVLDNRVSKRLSSFEMVREVLNANTLKLVMNEEAHQVLEIPVKAQENMWKSKESRRSMCEFWCHCLEQMRVIEDFYEITFDLKLVLGLDNLNELYDAVSFVYDGILLQENCYITIPGDMFDEDIIISEPVLFENNKILPLKPRIIHNFCFVPYQSWLMPGRIPMKDAKKEDRIKVPGCCRYKIIST